MKTAEEILWDETSKSMQEYIAKNEDLHGCIMDAMELFAEQFKSK